MLKKLKTMRINNHYSDSDMANMLGISKTFYWQIENGKRQLKYQMAVKIAEIFKIKPDDLFYDEFKQV